MSILLIEDDIDLGKVLSNYLEMNNFHVVHAVDGKSALQLASTSKIELSVIDVMLPDTNGFDLAKAMDRHLPNIPFLFLTAKNNKEDIIRGLKAGAEDYITKPFEPEELVLRINIALKRTPPQTIHVPEIGSCTLKKNEFKLLTPLKEYKLTQRETELLAFIIYNKNRLIKRETMLKKIWGDNDYFLGRSMDVFVSRLRKFFRDDPSISIETFRGVGYIFRDG